jgi:quinol monooxygenase YgiN
MVIVAGTLRIDPADRAAYLELVGRATALARATAGCRDFAQSADPIEADRINIFELWESDVALSAFRALPDDGTLVPAITSADVHRYRISAVEAP